MNTNTNPAPFTTKRTIVIDDAQTWDVIEWALRRHFGQCHSDACMARLNRDSTPAAIARRDADYEAAIKTYRAIIGIDPVAA